MEDQGADNAVDAFIGKRNRVSQRLMELELNSNRSRFGTRAAQYRRVPVDPDHLRSGQIAREFDCHRTGSAAQVKDPPGARSPGTLNEQRPPATLAHRDRVDRIEERGQDRTTSRWDIAPAHPPQCYRIPRNGGTRPLALAGHVVMGKQVWSGRLRSRAGPRPGGVVAAVHHRSVIRNHGPDDPDRSDRV